MDKNERLRAARVAAGFKSASAAAARFGWKVGAYRHHENGTAGYKPDSAAEYAAAFGVDESWLMFGRGRGPGGEQQDGEARPGLPSMTRGSDILAGPRPAVPPMTGARPIGRSIPILGEVAAGVWREAHQAVELPDDWDEEILSSRGIEFIALDVAGYERAKLFALRIVGPSMNKEYPEGRYVIAAPPAEAGLRNEDHVVVVRRDSYGRVETTVKELVITAEGKVELWPRSDHPDYQTPIEMNPRENDQDRPEIIGVVVADWKRRNRPEQIAVFPSPDVPHAE